MGGVAVVIGALAPTRRAAVRGAATYGFAFMLAGYDGTATMLSRLAFFAVLGLVGAGCAAPLALVGSLLRTPRRSRDS